MTIEEKIKVDKYIFTEPASSIIKVMIDETCNSDEHVWVCKEESGFLGEIETFRYLTLVEINKLKSNKNIETICPKGAIICTNCGQIAYENEKETNKFLRNIKNINLKTIYSFRN